MNSIGVLNQLDPSSRTPNYHIRKKEAEFRISTNQAVWIVIGEVIRKTPAWDRLTPDHILQKQWVKATWQKRQSGSAGPMVMQIDT